MLGISGEERERARKRSDLADAAAAAAATTATAPHADKGNDVALLKEEIELLKAEKAQALQTIEKLERTIAELRGPASHSPAPAVSPSVRQPAYARP